MLAEAAAMPRAMAPVHCPHPRSAPRACLASRHRWAVNPLLGNPTGVFSVAAAGQAVDTTSPTGVVGNGTPASRTGAAVVNAVAQEGVIAFNCGAEDVVIRMTSTAKVFNNRPDVTLDGGGKVTLDGGGSSASCIKTPVMRPRFLPRRVAIFKPRPSQRCKT